jgi:hypothetical protein
VGGHGLVLHWDGTEWTYASEVTMQDLTRVWGVDANNVMVVGADGTILRRDRSRVVRGYTIKGPQKWHSFK